MSEKFTASNGHRFESRGPDNKGREVLSMVFMRPNDEPFHTERQFAADDVQALREFFQHERDQELGRWRWPENPEYVVYRASGSRAVVIKELTGESRAINTLGTVKGLALPVNDLFERAATAWRNVSRKPWHDAKPGEVWALTVDGKETAFTLHGDLFRTGALWDIEQTDRHITAGRRIWPEAVES